MPLEILLVLVVVGVSAIALMLHLSGKSAKLMLTPDTARAAWMRHFPGEHIVDVILSHDGHAALIRTDTGSGLLWSFGADTVGRHLLDFDWIDHPTALEVQFHDFGTPRALIQLDETERQHWRLMMEPA